MTGHGAVHPTGQAGRTAPDPDNWVQILPSPLENP